MNTIINKHLVICLLLFVVVPSLLAQTTKRGLVISEVYLDEKQPLNNWIEIYNPTNAPQVLDRLRISHIKTLNVLPAAIQRSGGIDIGPNEYLVVCADGENGLLFEARIAPVVVNALSQFIDGGFVAILTQNMDETDADGFRYGASSLSSHAAEFLGAQVVPFSSNPNSYSRTIVKSDGQISVLGWHESEPTPGVPNK